jgi:hypothetical protein
MDGHENISLSVMAPDTGTRETLVLRPCPPDFPTSIAPLGMIARTAADCFPSSQTIYCSRDRSPSRLGSLLFHIYRVDCDLDLQNVIDLLESLDWLDPHFTTLVSLNEDLLIFQHLVPDKLKLRLPGA